jgi:hypothetical protein
LENPRSYLFAVGITLTENFRSPFDPAQDGNPMVWQTITPISQGTKNSRVHANPLAALTGKCQIG